VSDVQIVTGVIRSVKGALAVVTPNGRGDDQAPWPDVQDCRILTLTGSAGSASLAMQAMAGDECLLLFAGEDKTSPYCLPCSVSAPGVVSLRHGASHVTVSESSITAQAGASSITLTSTSATVRANSISLRGNVTVTGSLSVSGAMTNGNKNIGASHRHSNGTAQDGNTGAVV
jgi:hypothetical protein